jgi:hypothetical protein
MLENRADLIGEDGHFYEAVPLVCADDAEAVEKANSHSNRLNMKAVVDGRPGSNANGVLNV